MSDLVLERARVPSQTSQPISSVMPACITSSPPSASLASPRPNCRTVGRLRMSSTASRAPPRRISVKGRARPGKATHVDFSPKEPGTGRGVMIRGHNADSMLPRSSRWRCRSRERSRLDLEDQPEMARSGRQRRHRCACLSQLRRRSPAMIPAEAVAQAEGADCGDRYPGDRHREELTKPAGSPRCPT